jgi:hypothetical protein
VPQLFLFIASLPLVFRLPTNISLAFLQIIQVDLTSDKLVQLKEDVELTFTYTVNWLPTRVPFRNRFRKYLDHSFFEHKVGICERD